MMMAAVLVFLLLSSSVFQFNREWNMDRNRTYWFWTVLGLFIAWQFENWWLKGLCGILVLRLLVGPQPLDRIKRIDDLLLLAAAGALMIPYLTAAFIPIYLWTVVGIGLWCSLYTMISWWKYDPTTGYDWRPLWGKTILRFYELPSHISGGQGNPNHLHGLSAVSVAATLGLAFTETIWILLLVPIVLTPLIITQCVKTDNPGNTDKPHQGWAHIVALGLACLPLWSISFTAGLLLILSVFITMELVKHRNDDEGFDSGRAKLWWSMIKEWWPDGWLVRLFGWGPKEFEPHHTAHLVKQMEATKMFVVAHHAHSEYVHQLLEHGIVGLILLLGYITTTAWHLFTMGPEGQALYLVGATLCSVAFVSFPWSYYHEIMFRVMPATPNEQVQAKLFTLGTPALVAITFVLVILIEAIR